jgi:hypothetical protein
MLIAAHPVQQKSAGFRGRSFRSGLGHLRRNRRGHDLRSGQSDRSRQRRGEEHRLGRGFRFLHQPGARLRERLRSDLGMRLKPTHAVQDGGRDRLGSRDIG